MDGVGQLDGVQQFPKARESYPLGHRNVLILCSYPLNRVPGQTFRFEQYLRILKRSNIQATIEPFFDESTLNILYEPGHVLTKVLGVLQGFLRRVRTLFSVRRYDYVFVSREAAPLGPPIFEFSLVALGCRVIYDFDDAIFMAPEPGENRLMKWLKWRSKVEYVTKHSFKVTVSNSFLFAWASRLNKNVVLLPTTIDPIYYQPSRAGRCRSRPVIGWSGSHSTAKYLNLVRPVLKALQEDYDFEFRVICNANPGFPELKNYRFVKWRSSTEVEDLCELDIGLMPQPDDRWVRGKAGLKAIQYSALGIVPVVSPFGCGDEVVKNGRTGFVVNNTHEEWYAALKNLLENKHTWAELGKAAREHVLQTYSVPSQARVYVGLFQ